MKSSNIYAQHVSLHHFLEAYPLLKDHSHFKL